MAYKILVVDDEVDLELLVRQNFRRKIRANEMQFVFAHNGREALAQLREDKDIDMVMSDINMPEMDGLTLLNEVIKKYPLVRSVIVSAYGDMKNLRTAMNNGAFDFVTKPIDFEDLEKTLDKTLAEVKNVKESQSIRDQLVSVKKELDIGREIQTSFLPTTIPQPTGWDFAAHFQPAKEVAGDFYDIFEINEGKQVCFFLGDVCGKGVGSALFMTLCRSLLHAYALINQDKPDIAYQTVQMTHNYITTCHDEANMFATLFFGILEVETGKVTFVNCGHNSPVIYSSNGDMQELLPSGPVLGMFPSNDFKEATATIPKDAVLFIYTDGATDCINETQEVFGEEKVVEVVKELRSKSSKEILDSLLSEIASYSNGVDQYDDITLMTIKQ